MAKTQKYAFKTKNTTIKEQEGRDPLRVKITFYVVSEKDTLVELLRNRTTLITFSNSEREILPKK